MFEMFTAAKLARLRQVIAGILAAICGLTGALALYASWLLSMRPANVEASAVETALINLFGHNAAGALLLFGIVQVSLCAVLWFMSKLQAREWHGHNHEDMLQLLTKHIPEVVRFAMAESVEQLNAEVMFHRCVTHTKETAPRLQSDYAEYLALIVTRVVTDTSQLKRATASAYEEIAASEALVRKASGDLERAQLQLTQLQARLGFLRQTDSTNQQLHDSLMAEVTTLTQQLATVSGATASNVIALQAQPAE